jgi:hypothetical protein
VPLALSPTMQVKDLPVAQTQSRSEMRDTPAYSHHMAVSSDNSQSPRESRRCHPGGSKMLHGTLDEHDNDEVHRRQVGPWRNTHREDVCIGPANASASCRGRTGGGVHSENEHPWMFVHEQLSALDVLPSSLNPETLQSNVPRCSVTKNFSTRRAALVAPPKVVQANYVPSYQPPTRSKACTNPPHGPQAMPSIQPQSRRWKTSKTR